MAHQRQLSTAIISLTRSVEADVKKYSQGAHREKIVAVEAACKVLLAENTALKQRLKTTKLDAMRLAYDPDLMVRVNERTYPAFTALFGPVVAEALSFSGVREATPTLSLDKDKSYSCDAVRTALGMLHFAGFIPESITPQQLFETLQLAVHWELPIVARLHDLLDKVLHLASSTPAYGTAVELLSYTEDKLGAKCSECYSKCECCKDRSQVPPPACTCSLCDKCPGTACLKLRKTCITVLVLNASALSDEVVRGLPLVDMLPAVTGILESVPALEVRPAQAEELNLVHAKIVAAIVAIRAGEDSDEDSDEYSGDACDVLRCSVSEILAPRTIDGGKSATAGCFVRIKSTAPTRGRPAIVLTSDDGEYKWAAPFCTTQELGDIWHGKESRLRVAKKLEAGTAAVFKASVRIESTWMKYMLIIRFLRAHGMIDGAKNSSPAQVLIGAAAVLGASLLQAMRPILLEVVTRNFAKHSCDDLFKLDATSMAKLLTSEQLTVSTGVGQVIQHEIAGPAFSLSLTPIHSLRHRLVRSRQ